MKESLFEVVWPLGKSLSKALSPARHVQDLAGKTVCEIWDRVFRGEVMFPLIRETLKKRYSGIKIVDYDVFGNTHGPNETEVIAAIPGLLREHGCDVVISGVGA